MNNQLFQWNFVIQGLLPESINLKKIWLKKGEILLEKNGENLEARLLGTEENRHKNEEHITQYLRIASLISNNTTELIDNGGYSIKSKDEFGKQPKFTLIHTKIKRIIPKEIASDIEKHAPKLITFISKLHTEFENPIEDNEFLKLAITFYYNATQSIYTNEGFLNLSISLESLFNDGPSDINYKLAQRASFLIGLYGIDPIQATEKIKSLYKIRSKIVHGAGAQIKGEDWAQLAEYARLSITIFMLLLKSDNRKSIKNSDRKTSLLKEIDYAMLDAARRDSLRREIQRGKKQFKFPAPRRFEKQLEDGFHRYSPW